MKNNLNNLIKNLVGKNQFSDVMHNLELTTETDENKTEQRFINLQIKLNEWSPIYETRGYKYREKIAVDCFDKFKPINEQMLFSYVDHKISIENLIASTNDNTMEVKKENDIIYAKIKVNEDDYLSKKTANLIKSGAIKSNSFIFKAEDVDYVFYEDENKTDVDFEIIFKQGTLISIDPVYQGFYPTNEMSVTKSINDIFNNHLLNEENILKMKKNNIEVNNLELKNEAVDNNIIEPEDNINDINEDPINDDPNNENLNNETVINEDENNDNIVTKNEKIETISETELTNKINNIIEKRDRMSKPNFATQKVEVLDFKTIQTKFLNNEKLTKTEAEYLYKNSLPEVVDNKLTENLELMLNTSYSNYLSTIQERALNGTTSLNGLALAEVLQNNRVLTEWMLIFPELSTYAQIIPLVGFNKIEQTIAIADNTAVNKLAEDVEATAYNLGTAKVVLEADRYAIQFKQNNQLNKFNTMLAITTNNVKNKIIQTLREDFYDNLFNNVGQAFNKDSYDGGARKESIVYTTEIGKFSIQDLTNIANKLIEKYGDEVLNRYFITMSSDIYNHLTTEYYKNATGYKGIFDEVGRKFKGIQIILSDKIPDKTVEKGKNILAFLTKDSIIAYGCVTTIHDSATNFITTDQYLRVVQTRGRVRMCDPNINTIVLQVRSDASQISNKSLNETITRNK